MFTFLDEWVKAVNEHGGFGLWKADVVLQPKEVLGILKKYAANADLGFGEKRTRNYT